MDGISSAASSTAYSSLSARDAVFKRNDANGDGALSKEEFTTIGRDNKAPLIDKVYDRFDSNGDGSLDKDEFNQVADAFKARKEAGFPGLHALLYNRSGQSGTPVDTTISAEA